MGRPKQTKKVIPAEPLLDLRPINQDGFYKAIVERNLDSVLLFGANGVISYVSPGITALLGHTSDELMAASLFDMIHPDDLDTIKVQLAKVLNKPNAKVYAQTRLRHKNNNWVSVDATALNLLHDLTVGAIIVNLRDASQRLKIEQNLHYKSALLEAQNEATRDGILVVDTKGKILFHNKQFIKMWKIPSKIVQTSNDNAALEEAMKRLVDPVAFKERVDYLYANPNEVSHELIRFKDGQILDRYGAPIVDESGESYGWAWYFRDVTEDKQAEQAMRTQNEYLMALQETAVALTSRLDVVPLLKAIVEHAARIADTGDGYIYLVNDDAKSLSVRVGTGIFKPYIGKSLPKGEGIAGKVWQTGSLMVIEDYDEWEGRSPDIPKGLFHSIVCIPLKSGKKVVGAIALAHQQKDRLFAKEEVRVLKRLAELASIALDNAYLYEQARLEALERKQAEALSETLTEQQIRLVEINRSKDEFITLASHQLRTPATGVKQYIGMLLDGYAGDLNDEQRELVDAAYESNERQLVIINDLLQVAHLDTGRVSLQRQRTDIIDLLTDVIDEQADTFKGRQQGVKFVHDMAELVLRVDRDRLRMVLENIIDNASKYSLQGKTIIILVKQLDTEIQIEVQDQGVGIRKSDIDKLFKKFSRIDNPLSTLVGGTGLGLYWAKQVVDLHGGSITVSSKLNKGTCFTITLPLQ